MKENRLLFFMALVFLTGCALIVADFLLLVFFGLSFSGLILKFGIPGAIFIVIYTLTLGMGSKCFGRKFFENVKGEEFTAHLKTIGAVPIKMIGMNVALHAIFLSVVFFGSDYLNIDSAIKTPLYLAALSFGMLVGTFIYVVCDGLVSHTLIDFNFYEYPGDLREGRQSLKSMIVPLAVGIMSVPFTCAITLLSVRLAGGSLNDMRGWSSWSIFIIPIIVYLVCVAILALRLKKNTNSKMSASINEQPVRKTRAKKLINLFILITSPHYKLPYFGNLSHYFRASPAATIPPAGPLIAVRSFFSSNSIMVPVTKNAKASATGAAATTPHRPQILPKMSRQGMRAMHWRSSERKIDILGRPVTTKKFADTT